MASKKIVGMATVVALVGAAATANAAGPVANADEARGTERVTSAPVRSTYVGTFAGTTLVQRPYGSSVGGPQGDLNVSGGIGHFFWRNVALEIDIGATVMKGAYAGAAVVPGIVWTFHDVFYGAARFVVPVHPTVDFTAAPGVGAIYVFKNGFAPLVEVNALASLGQGHPSFGASATIGSLLLF